MRLAGKRLAPAPRQHGAGDLEEVLFGKRKVAHAEHVPPARTALRDFKLLEERMDVDLSAFEILHVSPIGLERRKHFDLVHALTGDPANGREPLHLLLASEAQYR